LDKKQQKKTIAHLATDVSPSVMPITGFTAAPISPNPTPLKNPLTPFFWASSIGFVTKPVTPVRVRFMVRVMVRVIVGVGLGLGLELG
jgi:hypothetical protein